MAQPIDYSQYTILYVDDEEQALKYFRKGLMGEFQVLTAPNVAAANVLLDAQADKIAVVITDQRMPGPQGTELLARVRELWPNITRILVTAYAELESAIDAVNSGAVFKYITKPVDWDDLRAKLTQAVDQHLTLTRAARSAEDNGDAVRRQIVADRVRSLSHMASGINHHVRNSITALSCFLEEANPDENAGASAKNPYLKNLWTAATEERDQLIHRIDEIHRYLAPAGEQPRSDLAVGALVQSALTQIPTAQATLTTDAGTAEAVINIAVAPATAALAALVKYTADRCGDGTPLVINVLPFRRVNQSSFIPIQITGHGPSWSEQAIAALFTPFDVPENDPSELGLALTAAFSFIYQAGGDILVHAAAPQGPGFEVLLPLPNRTSVAA